MTDAPAGSGSPPATSKRLLLLEKLTREKSPDPFHWYGLAMEYRSLERTDEAIQTFTQLRGANPEYTAMYLMCGQLLASKGRMEEARAWYDAGIAMARKKGESHALSELESALAELG
jgi:predicted Zn-dependent protease